jgi:hypothetical protein
LLHLKTPTFKLNKESKLTLNLETQQSELKLHYNKHYITPRKLSLKELHKEEQTEKS